MKLFLKRVVCGIVIGIGAVLPGVSGGIIAVSMGLYEGMIRAINGFFSAIRKNFLFLLPIGIGGVIGVGATVLGLTRVLELYETAVLALFCGLVLGTIPSLYDEARGDDRFKKRYVVSAVLGLSMILLFALLESRVTTNEKVTELTVLTAILAGAVISVGVVIPGISSSFLLIYLGWYMAFLKAIESIDIKLIFFLCVGFGLMALLLIRIVAYMLKRHHATSFFAIIGFVVGSVALIIPSVLQGLSWSTPLLFFAGLAISVLEGYYKARREAKKAAAAAEAALEEAQLAPVLPDEPSAEDETQGQA